MSTGLSKVEQSALSVSYDVLGTHIDLDLPFVKKYLVRGKGEPSDQELLFFMNACKAQGLNPLVGGEAYLIKYGKDDPAQLVIGKGAFMRRVYSNPNYICKQDGITVQRGDTIVQKEGCCLYPGEVLIGGWCRVTYLRAGRECSAFREVAFSEYNKGKNTWNAIPATMINKVAISQCIREAFPNEYEGLYSEEEMIASGAIPAVEAEYTEVAPAETVVAAVDPIITNEQRQELFRTAQKYFKESANGILKDIITRLGFTSTAGLKTSDFVKIMGELEEIASNSEQPSEPAAQPSEPATKE